jgi:hypothetical protein
VPANDRFTPALSFAASRRTTGPKVDRSLVRKIASDCNGYADLWLQKSAPLDAINHALEEALD